MKGGKQGRKRMASGGSGNARPSRGKLAKNSAKNVTKKPANAAPKKGSRKKAFGALPAKDDE